jgi:hypothetical protein
MTILPEFPRNSDHHAIDLHRRDLEDNYVIMRGFSLIAPPASSA